jgi:hypothetical protein
MFHRPTQALSCVLALSVAFSSPARSQEQNTPQVNPAPAVAAVAPIESAPQLPAKSWKGKADYTGPTTVVELTPAPVLDAEGRQRLDPDGKPMFDQPIRQRRDKKGHPVVDEGGKPIFQTARDRGYDENGKKIPLLKEKAPKTILVNITHGTFTVDGLTGKAALNYEIKDLKYIYLYVPWIGTTIVSNASFPGSKEQKDAFDDRTLTVIVSDHTLQLYSDTPLLRKKPEPAYVLVDRDFKLPAKFPVIGYGATLRAPYEWPGATESKLVTGAAIPPPMPDNLKPALLLSACPTGQMRIAGPNPLPGQIVTVQSCVLIEKAIAAKLAPTPAHSTTVLSISNPNPE